MEMKNPPEKLLAATEYLKKAHYHHIKALIFEPDTVDNKASKIQKIFEDYYERPLSKQCAWPEKKEPTLLSTQNPDNEIYNREVKGYNQAVDDFMAVIGKKEETHQCKDCGSEFNEKSYRVEHDQDCYCGGVIAKKMEETQPPRIEMDETGLIEILMECMPGVEEVRFHRNIARKIIERFSPPQVLDEKAVIQFLLDYNISCGNCDNSTGECKECQIDYCNQLGNAIVQTFSTSFPTVNQINEVIAEQWLQGNIVCTEHKDRCNVDGFRVSTAIHLLKSRGNGK